MRTLVGPLVRLEPVTQENCDELWDILQQPGLRDFQDLPDDDRRGFRRLVAARPRRLEPNVGGRFEWLIFVENDVEPIGWVSLRTGDRSFTGEIGYSVLEAYRRRGVAAAAVRALLDEAFSVGDLRRARAFCVPQNVASRSLLVRLGFVEDGLLTRGATVRGRPVDVLGFVMERDRWRNPPH